MNPTDIWIKSRYSPTELASALQMEDVTAIAIDGVSNSTVGQFAGATIEIEKDRRESVSDDELRISRHEEQDEIDGALLAEIVSALVAVGVDEVYTGERRCSHEKGVYRYNYRQHGLT